MENHFLFAILQCVFSLVLVFARGQIIPGFISIDCGASENYSDGSTGIFYTTDLNYLDDDRSESRSISPRYQTADVAQQYRNVRSFSQGRKNCYTLRPTDGKNRTYLIRASFMYGNYDSENQLPEFDLYLGADKWTTVKVEDPKIRITVEIIHTLQSDYTYVCLVKTDSSVPFISVLEMRLLNRDNGAYVTPSGSLVLEQRLDLGLSSGKIVRFKDDASDRIWSPFNNDTLNVTSTSSKIDPFSNFAPPSLVMSTVVTPRNSNDPLEMDWSTSDNSIAEVYMCLHFAEIEELSQNQTRQLTIYVNDNLWFGPFVPTYLRALSVYSVRTGKASSLHVLINKTENSTLPPILSAFEVFTVKPMILPLTDQDDVDAIMKIKSVYELNESTVFVERDWQGDPCTPSDYMWGGLNCSFNNIDPPRIISLNLSSSGLTGVITTNIADLKMLKTLDLSNNRLSGPVPDFLSQMPSLSVLNLENNNFSGTLPMELQEKVDNRSILLRADGNLLLCLTNPCNNTTGDTKKKNTNKVLIPVVVSSVAAFVVLLLSAGLVIWFLKRKKQEQAEPTATTAIAPQEELEFRKQNFTYSEILSITNNFEHIIGKGGFGRVYHGLFNGSQVAVKMLSCLSDQGSKQFKTEARVLTRVRHRNLTALVGYCDEVPHIGLVYEYMSNGDLARHLSEKNSHTLSWEERLKIAIDTAQGLEYLHNGCKPPIIHRDVKTTNILLNEKLQAKLSDFGLSRAFSLEEDSHVSTIVAGTPGYLDPEYYISSRLTEKSDVYSFGVVLLEIITGRAAIVNNVTNGKNHITEWVKAFIPKGDISIIVDPRLLHQDFNINSVWKAVELARACVSNASHKRPIMNQVVIELNQCLSMEMARNNTTSDTIESSDFFRVLPLDTELSPLPR